MTTLVYPVIADPAGVGTYARRIINGLRKQDYAFNEYPVVKKEYSFLGRPVGGIISQILEAPKNYGQDRPVHALSPELSGKKVDIVTIHDVIPLQYPDIYQTTFYSRYAWNTTFSRATAASVLLSSSFYGKEKILEFLKVEEDRVKVLYHSVEHEVFYPDERNPYPDDGKIHLLTVGDYNPRKKYDVIYKAVSGNEDMELFHIGPANAWSDRQEYLKKLASKSKNIKILGKVDNNTLRQYYSNADLMIYLSVDEGFGLPPLESIACGTKVLVSDIPIFRELLEGAAFFTSDADITESIRKALDEKKDRNELVEYSRKYTLEREIKGLIGIYNSFSK